jgi:isopentenyl diphosphate isomerase/L-lactate dehydrogenase-like FMN-dependent dehydrogenase
MSLDTTTAPGSVAVMIGRASLWGLAANGQTGVENVLDIFHGGIDAALLSLGHETVATLSPADVHVPIGFTRVPGGAGHRAA